MEVAWLYNNIWKDGTIVCSILNRNANIYVRILASSIVLANNTSGLLKTIYKYTYICLLRKPLTVSIIFFMLEKLILYYNFILISGMEDNIFYM